LHASELPGDVVLAVVSDEEAGSIYGARFLVDEHAELFQGIRYALGEAGGFTVHFRGRRFYPIQVAEKQFCWVRARIRGASGHGSLPRGGGAMSGLAAFLRSLERRRLPVYVTPVTREMFSQIAAHLGGIEGWLLRAMLHPRLADRAMDLAMIWPFKERTMVRNTLQLFEALLHNTVSPTGLHASEQINVVPGEVTVELDGRLLPGFPPEALLRELRDLMGEGGREARGGEEGAGANPEAYPGFSQIGNRKSEIDFELVWHDPGPTETDMGFYEPLAEILREMDMGGLPVPVLLSGVTDARFFSKLGIQTYGFTPMKVPPGFDFAHLAHAADERIPVEAVEFGTRAFSLAMQRR